MTTLVFAQTFAFTNQWQALRFGDEALRALEAVLMQNPEAGAVQSETGGVRKVRFAPAGRGKSGAVRVVYLYLPTFGQIYLLVVFAKAAQSNLTKGEKNEMRKLVAKIVAALEKGTK